MPWLDFLWQEGDNGNIAHVAEHDLTPEDIEYVFHSFYKEEISRSSGRPIRYGTTPDGRDIVVVFEWIDATTVYPITAYEPFS